MSENDHIHVPKIQYHQRLWTPWRMRYVGGDRSETGCIFCNRLQANDDRASLILHRGHNAFVMMNLFPYNTGHVMIVPNAHEPSPETLDDDTLEEMARLVPRTLKALRRALNPAGFNLGTNVGADAGAGIEAHLHQHIVPRWQGDANFMPILANTMVLPEMIPVTYARVRAEFAREHADAVTLIAIDPSTSSLLVESSSASLPPALPRVPLTGGPVWQTVARFLGSLGANGVLAGWAGAAGPATHCDLALAVEVEPGAGSLGALTWRPLVETMDHLLAADVALVSGAVDL